MVDHARLAFGSRRLAIHAGIGGKAGGKAEREVDTAPWRLSVMKRRAILAGIIALLAPRSLIAQTPSRDGPRRLGVLMGNLADDPVGQTYTASLMGLRALDWHEGGNLRIDWRWAGGDPALF